MAGVDPQAAAAKKDGDAEEKNAKKPEETQECDNKGKKDKPDGEEDDEGADSKKGKAKEKDEGKKAAAVVLTTAEPLKGMRAESDIQAIGALCKMAGCPDKAAEFLTKKKSNGQYFSVAEVSEELTAARVIGKREEHDYFARQPEPGRRWLASGT